MKGTIEIAIVYCLQGLTTITGVDFNKVALSLFIVYAWQLATILVSSWLFFCGLLLVLQGWMSAVFWLCPLAVTCPLYRVPWVMIPWVSILWNRQQLYAVSLSWLRLWWNSTWVPGWRWVPLECSRWPCTSPDQFRERLAVSGSWGTVQQGCHMSRPQVGLWWLWFVVVSCIDAVLMLLFVMLFDVLIMLFEVI